MSNEQATADNDGQLGQPTTSENTDRVAASREHVIREETQKVIDKVAEYVDSELRGTNFSKTQQLLKNMNY